MKRIQHKLFLGLIFCLAITPFLQTSVTATPVQVSSAYDLIAAVNSVRAANGLPAFQINGALMGAAQAHSDYQASINTATHSGAGGSTPKSRALGSGYGDGAAVYVTENIYAGMNASAQQAVSWWQGDSLHRNTLLSSAHVDAGAGVATSGDTVYYTLDVGYISGQAGEDNTSDNSQAQPAFTTTPGATRAASSVSQWITPIKLSTPAADGSITHEVKSGQALISIALAYKIKLADLLARNGLTEKSIIYPGQKLLIQPANSTPAQETQTVSATLTATLTLTPFASAIPTFETATTVAINTPIEEEPTLEPTLEPTSPPPASALAKTVVSDPLLMVAAILIASGTVLLIAGAVLRRGA